MGGTANVEVGDKGRVVIPAEIRRRLGLHRGARLVATVRGQAIVMVPEDAVLEELWQMFADVPGSMVDELIAERRAEAARESEAP